jgi:hypothetical protein
MTDSHDRKKNKRYLDKATASRVSELVAELERVLPCEVCTDDYGQILIYAGICEDEQGFYYFDGEDEEEEMDDDEEEETEEDDQ